MIEKQVYPKADVSKQLNAAEKALAGIDREAGRERPAAATGHGDGHDRTAGTSADSVAQARRMAASNGGAQAGVHCHHRSARANHDAGARRNQWTPHCPGPLDRRQQEPADRACAGQSPLAAAFWPGHRGQRERFRRRWRSAHTPKVLDWLANEFTRNGWSVKKMHRLIVTSAAHRVLRAMPRITNDNALLAHFPRRRLDGEAIRDSMLAVSGLLNLKAGGPSIYPELPAEIKPNDWNLTADAAERHRRSIYVAVKRNPLPALQPVRQPRASRDLRADSSPRRRRRLRCSMTPRSSTSHGSLPRGCSKLNRTPNE